MGNHLEAILTKAIKQESSGTEKQRIPQSQHDHPLILGPGKSFYRFVQIPLENHLLGSRCCGEG